MIFQLVCELRSEEGECIRGGVSDSISSATDGGGAASPQGNVSLSLSLSLSFLPLLSRLALEPTGDTLFSLNPASTELHTLDLITQTSGNVFRKTTEDFNNTKSAALFSSVTLRTAVHR